MDRTERHSPAESVPDVDLPIIDAHHHLYLASPAIGGHGEYMLPDMGRDLADGHNVIATVYVECSQLYRRTGPEALRVAGEAEFAAVMGRMSDTGHFGKARICEGFVGRADLETGAAIEPVLAALENASDGRLRGIRCPTIWDPDPGVNPSNRGYAPQGIMADPGFREGLAKLAQHGLVYDAWQYFPQLAELADLADAVPEATIVTGHCGGLLGTHGYARPETFAHWRGLIVDLARRPNVVMKLGGLANSRTGFGFAGQSTKPSVQELVTLWSPYIETCIEAFGPDRCLFESNFPVDHVAASYRDLWTVYKTIAAGCSAPEKAALFAGTARRIYRLT